MSAWTPKRAAATSRRNLDAAEKSLLRVAYQWGDVDEYVIGKVDEAVAALGEIREAVSEAAEGAET